MERRSVLKTGLGLAAAAALPSLARAQGAWAPAKPMRIVVPYTPGGASDITARLVAERLGPVLGQPVVVENRAGASGITGTDLVAKADADGHTLALIASSHVVNKALFPTIPFDPLEDFAPVTMTAQVQLVMVVPTASVPAQNVQEFVAWARPRQNQLAFASSGNGSNPHIFAADFLDRAQLRLEHVTYRGSTAAHADLLAGRTHLMFDAYAAVTGHARQGTLKVLALAGPERSALLPDLPTVAEQGFPGYGATSWGGVLAPKGTPAAAIERLNREIVAILRSPEIRERLAVMGAEVVGSSPQEFGAFMRREQERYVALTSRLGIRGTE
jgi:tripartite-type tricarboxylate transporter receptor subunit TctC